MTPKQEVQARVSKFFDREPEKIKLWWETKNPLLGDCTPSEFAMLKGWEKLLKNLKNWQEGNFP